MIANLNVVPFVSVDHMMQLVLQVFLSDENDLILMFVNEDEQEEYHQVKNQKMQQIMDIVMNEVDC